MSWLTEVNKMLFKDQVQFNEPVLTNTNMTFPAGAILQMNAGSALISPNPTGGIDYYVDIATGASTNSGLSPLTPFAQVTQAITASEAIRASLGNPYARNRIFINPSGATRYNNLTVLPNYTDVIGLGAEPRGDGTGIVRIGAASGAAGATAAAMHGTNWFNIQFSAGGAYYAFDTAAAYRSGFYNCTAGCASDNASATGGWRITAGLGVVFDNCANIQYSGTLTYGIANDGTGNFTACKIKDCLLKGSTAALLISAYLADNTEVKNNICIGGTYGIHDVSTQIGIQGVAFYAGNYCYGSTTGMAMAQGGTIRAVGNMCSDNGTGSIIVALS